jgi:hypothetical protein
MKWIKSLIYQVFLVSVVFGLTGCTTPQSGVSKRTSFAKEGGSVSKGRVSQAELQDDLLRFESQFNALIESASQALETSTNPKIRYRSALNRLIYGSNSLNIALGPIPEANLLDMITFIELSRDVLEKHWIPNVFGASGQPLEQAFLESSLQIWAISEKVLDTQQKNVLQSVIREWRSKHPNQINVETVRLSTFSKESAAKAAGLEQNVGGLFASLEQSTQSVDSMKLYSERVLYYAERAPFLFRLQTRLGANEIINDASLNLARLPNPLAQESTIRGLLKEVRETLLIMRTTLGDANSTIQSVNSLTDQMSDNPQPTQLATAMVTQLTTLLKEWNHTLTSSAHQKGVSQAAAIANQVGQQSNGFLKKAAWLGFGLITFFWVMFLLSKIAYYYFLQKVTSGVRPESRNEHKDRVA